MFIGKKSLLEGGSLSWEEVWTEISCLSRSGQTLAFFAVAAKTMKLNVYSTSNTVTMRYTVEK